MKLTIIVPMYKVELYVRECLKSILNQKGDFEVIAVDDGSPDRSGEIAHNLAIHDSRLRVISQQNKGLSGARNEGLSKACGEYVWFIDSDDWIAPDSIKLITSKLEKYSPEALHVCGADVIENKPQKIYSLAQYSSGYYSGITMIKEGSFHGVVQYTIYKRDFINKYNLRFFEGIYHEDTEFSPRAYYYLKKIICLDDIVYLKRVNNNSITRTVNIKKNFDLIKVSESLRKFASNLESKDDRRLYMRLSANAFKLALSNESSLMSRESRKELNRRCIEKKYLLKSFFESDRVLYKVHALLLYLFPWNMVGFNKVVIGLKNCIK